jgi:ATP-dependent Clp protease ATP-binding subunit ClpB
MTSNVGSQWIQDFSLTEEERQQRSLDVLRTTFKPEFLNRIDDIINFRSLTMNDIYSIIEIQIGFLGKRLENRNLSIELTDAAKRHIAELGYSVTYGARPLKRAIQKNIEDELAIKILDGTFVEGDMLLVDVSDDGRIIFAKK